MISLSRLRSFILIAFAILMIIALNSALAQKLGPDGAPNPTASTMTEQQLLQQSPRIEGDIAQPIERARVLIQPAGRAWDYFHQVTLRWIGAIAILGMIAVIAAFHFAIGRLRISAGRSGQKILRFNSFERFAHWLTAVSFVILALTGLNITFGRITLLPVMGPEAFSSASQFAKYFHNYVSASFVVGLVLLVALWIKDNIPRKVDVDWVRQGGGFIKSKHAPAGRFNAGEKLVFWTAFGAGAAVTVSGALLLFPFYVTNIAGMQLALIVHSVIAVLFVAVIIAHIYIGTLGTEGAFEAMGTGEVDLNWAEEHHDLWLKDELAKKRHADQSRETSATPGE
ncbi:formate dehydrogenase subunit gamma [Bradyrhizobium liaoningense]|uniref:formate dehydrogenase subunit gamma n=1 Tax=Bradyrhizobium liaoningense TaxID=43992 RepID=UPI001BACF7D2|nr:formate dehydrogenase subunit gamma [Bradyrhizobium liaoningense]MBR1170207.1 formate dehydrogenase subunit gamma [Bradyrhizobium liaoningense]